MQAMAPGVQGELQLGQVVGSCGVLAAAGAAGLLAGAAAAPAAAAAGALAACGWVAPGTANSCLHLALTQRTFLPAALSGTCMAVLQCGQLMTFGMVSFSLA